MQNDRSFIINIFGLPGSGKTTLATELVRMLGAVHINADWARNTVTKHLGFSAADRIEQARVLGSLSAHAAKTSRWVVVDFVNPTAETRQAFELEVVEQNPNARIVPIWMDTIASGRFDDTNAIFERPAPSMFEFGLRKIPGWLAPDDFVRAAQQISRDLRESAGYDRFYIRYNTASDGKSKHWRVIRAEDMSEILVDGFELHGDMFPASTIEYDVLKWNVGVEGVPEFTHAGDSIIFKLSR